MITQEELLRHKEKIDFLSEKVKKSYESVMRLHNEISFERNLDSGDNSLSAADNLIYILSDRIIDHLTSTHSLLSTYEEYFKMLEKSNPQVKMGEK